MRNLVWAVVVAILVGIGGYGLTGALQGLDFGSSGAASAPSSSAASPSPSGTPSPAATPSAPSLSRFDPSASDQANLELFRRTLDHAAQSTASSSVEAKTLTDALSAAGFDASSMQRSADRTSANLQAPTLTVSVHLKASCLVGQFVRSDASISAEVAAPIATGACLIGRQPTS